MFTVLVKQRVFPRSLGTALLGQMREIYSDGEKTMSNINFQMQNLVSESKIALEDELRLQMREKLAGFL